MLRPPNSFGGSSPRLINGRWYSSCAALYADERRTIGSVRAQPLTETGRGGAICVEAGSPDHLGEGLRRMFHWYQLSKYWEYLDTLFLVLNGKDLSFLHVYHHGVVSSMRAQLATPLL